jgi:hypothetical protein
MHDIAWSYSKRVSIAEQCSLFYLNSVNICVSRESVEMRNIDIIERVFIVALPTVLL